MERKHVSTMNALYPRLNRIHVTAYVHGVARTRATRRGTRRYSAAGNYIVDEFGGGGGINQPKLAGPAGLQYVLHRYMRCRRRMCCVAARAPLIGVQRAQRWPTYVWPSITA